VEAEIVTLGMGDEVVAVGKAHPRGERVIGVVADEAVRPDDIEGADERRAAQVRAHLVLELGIVVGKLGRGQLVGEPGQHEIHRLHGALGLLAQGAYQT